MKILKGWWYEILSLAMTAVVMVGVFSHSEKLVEKKSEPVTTLIPGGVTTEQNVVFTPLDSLEEKGSFSSIRVGAVNYTVKWRHGSVRCDGNISGSGCTNYLKQLMEINVDQGPDQIRDTVLHEVLHTVVGFDENIMNQNLNFTNEGVAYKSSILIMVLRDNPDLTKFLLEK